MAIGGTSGDSIVAFYDRPGQWFLSMHLRYHAFIQIPAMIAATVARVMKEAGVRRVLDFGSGGPGRRGPL